ncbi:uncharacterized protein [Argopecten irradians]|uniref:uncharacterized protein n=1 Tax=Argopecten irradians TaxID=31199 RepID=UPI003716655A
MSLVENTSVICFELRPFHTYKPYTLELKHQEATSLCDNQESRMTLAVVIALCVLLSVPGSHGETPSCERLEIPASTLNCSAVESVYLTCACNVYKTSILEIIGSIPCYLPPTAMASLFQDQIYEFLGMVMTTTAPPTRVLSSLQEVQVSLSSYDTIDLLLNVSEKLGEEVFNKVCAHIDQLKACVNTDFIISTLPDDLTLKALFNLQNLDEFLTTMCANKEELFGESNCFVNSLLPIGVCGYLPVLGSSGSKYTQSFPLFSGTAISDTQFLHYCPMAGDFVRCAAIQLKEYSENCAAMTSSWPSQLLTSTCSELAATGSDFITTSTVLMCAVPHVEIAIPIVEMFEGIREPTTYEIQNLIETIINAACGVLPNIFTCIAEQLPTSTSRFDIFLRELIDSSQLTYGTAIADVMCQPERIKAISAVIPCVIVKSNDIEECGTEANIMVFENFNISSIGNDANKDRQEFCGPVMNLAMCVFEAALVPCDSEIADFAKEVFFWIMQTQCNGERNGTFQEVIESEQQKQQQQTTTRKADNLAPAFIGNSRFFWLSALFVSILKF